MGFGQKSDFTAASQLREFPGAKYQAHEIASLAYQSRKNNPRTQHGFFNKYDKWDKTCYKGMEQAFYGREGQGPGAYLAQGFVVTSPTRNTS
jgi:hypothetical protein